MAVLEEFEYAQVLKAYNRDTTNASITAIAAPAAGSSIKIVKWKFNVLTAETILVLAGASEIDSFYFGPTGGVTEDWYNDPIILPAATALVLQKVGSALTPFSWRVQYIVDTH